MVTRYTQPPKQDGVFLYLFQPVCTARIAKRSACIPCVGCLWLTFGEMHRERPSHCPGDYCKVMLRASDADSSSLFHWQSLSAGYRKKDAEELRVKQPFCPRFPHLLPLYISSAVSQCRRAVTALAHACDTWLQRKNCKPLSLKQH